MSCQVASHLITSRAAGSAKSRAARFSVHLVALPASTALGEVERPQAAKRPRTRGWGQQGTGKEEDVEVGLQYFGKRYYAPALNQWLSADPLEIHASGGSSDQNSYAYVGGKALKNTDPQGLTVPCANRCEEVAFPLGSPVVPLQEWVASWKEAESLPGPAKWAIRAALINYSPQYVSEALSRATSGADLLLAGVGGSRVAGKAAYRLTALLAGRKATPEVVGLLRGVGKASFGEQGRGWSIIKKLGLHKSIAADFAKLSGKAWAQGRDALFSMNPTVRGELGEQILAHGEYKGWKHVGELNDGKFRAVDFQKGNVQAQVTYPEHGPRSSDRSRESAEWEA